LSLLEVGPRAAIAFEDFPNGIRAAKAAGLFCVVVANPVTKNLDLTGGDLYLDVRRQDIG
jgi:beta-phosphoglucomutase-like phosphatase (HAD superfamily)